MGKRGEPRLMTAVRMSEAGRDALDKLAATAGVNRSEMVRRLLKEALADPKIKRKVTRTD